MKTNYQYPLEEDWSAADIIAVTTFYRAVEDAYELPGGVAPDHVMAAYAEFKKVVPGKAQEKQLGRAFEQVSGYSLYQTVKAAREGGKRNLRMEQGGQHG